MNQFTLSFLVRQLGIRTSLFQTLHTLFGDIIVQYVPCSETTTIDSHGCVVWTYTFCVQDVDLPSGVASVCAITPDILEIPYMTAVAPLYFEDSETVDVQGNGSSILPYSFHAIIDPDADNIITANANGLYAEETAALTLNIEDEGGVVNTVPVNTLNFTGGGVAASQTSPGEVAVVVNLAGGGLPASPADNSTLVACGGSWVEVPRGMEFYPTTRTLLWTNTTNGDQTHVATLSNKPDVFACSAGLRAVISVSAFAIGPSGSPTVIQQVNAYINGVNVLGVNDESAANGAQNNTLAIVDVGLGAATTPLRTVTSGSGSISVQFYLEGYFQ